MIWIFGLITGLLFDLPGWWWAFGFIFAMLQHIQVTAAKRHRY